jgi:hypothetical protein
MALIFPRPEGGYVCQHKNPEAAGLTEAEMVSRCCGATASDTAEAWLVGANWPLIGMPSG